MVVGQHSSHDINRGQVAAAFCAKITKFFSGSGITVILLAASHRIYASSLSLSRAREHACVIDCAGEGKRV